MNRAGEGVKGATSARQLSGYQPASRAAGRPRPALAGARRRCLKGGWSKLWSCLRLETAVPLIGGFFSVICGFSDAGGRAAATPSHVRQAGAPPSNRMRAERGDLFTAAAIAPAVWVLPGDPPYTGARGPANARVTGIFLPLSFCSVFGLAVLASGERDKRLRERWEQ